MMCYRVYDTGLKSDKNQFPTWRIFLGTENDQAEHFYNNVELISMKNPNGLAVTYIIATGFNLWE